MVPAPSLPKEKTSVTSTNFSEVFNDPLLTITLKRGDG
jgi:hypothetical protein